MRRAKLNFRLLGRRGSGEADTGPATKNLPIAASKDPTDDDEDSSFCPIEKVSGWAGDALARDGSLRFSRLDFEVLGADFRRHRPAFFAQDSFNVEDSAAAEPLESSESENSVTQSSADLTLSESHAREGRCSVFDTGSFLACNEPQSKGNTTQSEATSNGSSVAPSCEHGSIEAERLSNSRQSPSVAPLNIYRVSDAPSSSSASYLQTPGSSFEASPNRALFETPPTPLSPISPSRSIAPSISTFKDRRPPPRWSLRPSTKAQGKRQPSIVHLSHELSKTNEVTHDTDGSNPVEDSQLKGLGIRPSDARAVFLSTGRVPLTCDGTSYTDDLLQSVLDYASSPTKRESTSSALETPQPPLLPPPPIPKQRRSSEDEFQPQRQTTPIKHFLKNQPSLPSLQAIQEDPFSDSGGEYPSTFPESTQSTVDQTSENLSTVSDTDTIKPLHTITLSSSQKKFLDYKKHRAEGNLKRPASRERLDRWMASAATLVPGRPKPPALPQDRPINGPPSTRHMMIWSSLTDLAQLRIKLGLGLQMPPRMNQPTHPNHPFAWDTKNVWCTQCMLEPCFIKGLHDLELKNSSSNDVNNPPTALTRSVPITCRICEVPCCIWAERQFFLQSTERKFVPHPALDKQSNYGALKNSSEDLLFMPLAARGKLVKARMEAFEEIQEIESKCLYGRDTATFLRCAECSELVCPGCAGKCPEELCGLTTCRACVPNPWAKCALHSSGKFSAGAARRTMGEHNNLPGEKTLTESHCLRGKLPTLPKDSQSKAATEN